MKLPTYEVFEDEDPDIMEELKKFFPDPQQWLDTPHDLLWGARPRDLIGTDKELRVRNLLRRLKYGIPT
jgi:uncharacterized protein (DUF2384 family)